MARRLAPKDGGVFLDGYREQLRAEYEREVLRGDPRLMPDITADWSSDERRRTNAASPAIQHAQRMIERLDAGEEITTGRPGSGNWPELASVPWYADYSVRLVRVSADDTVRPVYE
jgi:hypothetical protein